MVNKLSMQELGIDSYTKLADVDNLSGGGNVSLGLPENAASADLGAGPTPKPDGLDFT